MSAIAERDDRKSKTSRRLERDDAHLGGERGRGAAGRTPFMAAVEASLDIESRHHELRVVNGFRKAAISKLARSRLAAGSGLVNDRLACRRADAKAGCNRFPMTTGSGRNTARRPSSMRRWLLP
jgi:hypothetical protein